MEETQFLVQWDEHPTHLATRLGYLLEHQSLVDVTLMCNTHTLKVHRAVLAACSPYFERQLGNHPLIVLKDMKFSVLKSLVEFMYCGETSVSEENLTPLLEAAKFFEVKGLAAMTKESVRYSNNSAVRLNGTTPQVNQVHTPVYMRGSGGRGRGRGRGRPPLGTKVSSPTEPAQILLSLSGNQPSPQLYTTSRNVKIDPSVLADPTKNKVVTDSQPRRRGRRRSALNTAIRERILRDNDGSEDPSPLLSSLLGKSEPTSPQSQDNTKYLQTLKDFGLPTDVPILYDNGEGKLVKLTESALKTMMSADSNVQFHIAEGSLQEAEVVPSSSVSDSTITPKKSDNTMCEMVFDKENRNFVIKETDTLCKEEEERDQLNETDLESLKNGAVTLVESDPDAVVMFEVTDNKKVQKCVLSAKDVDTLRVLNEQLTKQKSQLASMTNGLSPVEIVGNAQIQELKLKIHNTTSILAQIVEKVQGLKNIKELSNKMLGESSTSTPKPSQQSQVVQLEFIDGNGEKIEGYQVEGTVVENKMEKKKEDGVKENDLMCLLDMVCDENERGNLMSEVQERQEDKERDIGLGDDATDSLMGETEGENNYLVMNNHHLGQQNMEYENIDDMMPETEHNGMETKPQDRYIIDNDGNIINQDESYVVYHDVKEEMTSNEYVIYDGAESVLPDMTASNPENYDEGEEDSQVRNEEDCSQEYIVYRDESKAVLSDEIKPMSPSVEGGHYIVYSDDNPDRSQDSISNKTSQVKTDFVMFGPDKITEDDVDSLLDKPNDTSQSSELLTLKDPLVSFTDDRRKKIKDSSELIHKRRSSSNSDSSESAESKKQKLTLQDDIDSS